MQSDTVVGIVGAVVLVAVMVGVFVYEYNNVELDGGDNGGGDGDDAAMKAAFNMSYPGLVAEEDLDGDGVANYMDDDIDEDGIPNAEDDDVAVTETFSGSFNLAVAAPFGPFSTIGVESFDVHTGASMIEGTWSYDPTAVDLPVTAFEATLRDPENSGVASSSGASGTVSTEGDLARGEWDIRFSTDTIELAGSYSLTVVITYDPSAPMAES